MTPPTPTKVREIRPISRFMSFPVSDTGRSKGTELREGKLDLL